MQHERPDWKKERLLELLTGRIVGIATRLGRVVGALPQRRSVPTATENQRAAKGEVCLLEGCVMRHMYPGVHQATRNLLGDVGFSVAAVDLGCCGALHAHNGFLGKGERMAAQVATLAQGRPIVVNSAGCGSHLKSCGVDAPDISEFLLEHGLVEKLRLSKGLLGTATYHDACHLCHGQGIRNAPRELLAAIPGLKVVPLPFSDRCCGSAGIYNILQPKMAKELQERKVDTILESGAEMVILGNPGCDAWIQKGLVRRGSRVRVLHLAELLNQALHA
jgi:glycolate oxidase iron-sulfur subunit